MESDWVYCHFRQKKDSLNNFFNWLGKKINKGVELAIPAAFKEALIERNYSFLQAMATYFESPYPKSWYEKYKRD